jgi:hypothetical protein
MASLRLPSTLTWLAASGALALPLAPARAQVTSLPFDLVDVADDPLAPDHCGVSFTWLQADPINLAEAGGASIADFDSDGLQDIYLPNNKTAPSHLYRNLGGFQFQEVAAAHGVDDPNWASADGLFLDYDHDGDLDLLVVCLLGKPTQPLGPTPFRLFRNAGAGAGHTFVNVTIGAGFVLGPTAKQTLWGLAPGVCAGDWNHDGWTDLFSVWESGVSAHDQWRLLRNDPNPVPGDGGDPAYTPRIFSDATVGSGLEGEYGGRPNQPQFWDVNRDGWPDLHIAGDDTLDNMFINDKDGTFTDVATAVGLNGDPPEFRNEMGTCLGDPDNDLDLDLHSTNISNLDRYYRNDSIGTALGFTDIAVPSGLNDSTTGWGTVFVDLDNDGDEDHATVTGPAHPALGYYINPVDLNLFPQMLPGDIGVAWAGVTTLLPEFGAVNLPSGDNAHGLAAGDLDNDGDMDLVMTRNKGEKAGVFKNTLVSKNGWLQVDLVNEGGSLDITGSRAYVKRNGVIQVREVVSGSSTQSQDAPRLHFGLGPPTPPRGKVAAAGGSGVGPGALGAGSTGAATGLGGPGVGGTLPPSIDPTWLVVRWLHGACQVLMHPPRDTILVVERSAVDDTGDLDADGHLTAADLLLLQELVADPAGFALQHPESPGPITGDVDFNGLVDGADLAAWALLPPH